MTQSFSRFRKIGSGNGSDENSNRCNAVISRLTALNVYGVLRHRKPEISMISGFSNAEKLLQNSVELLHFGLFLKKSHGLLLKKL